jgi:lipid-binding SYLF domain-containing protein
MLTSRNWLILVAWALLVGSTARARDETDVERSATTLLEEISSNPKSGIAPEVLREARGIMIMPHYVETQLGVGREKGRGVCLLRDDKGNWEKPIPVNISGLSFGVEAGRKVADRVVIYRTRKAAESDSMSSFMMGASFEFYRRHKDSRHKFSGPRSDIFATKDRLVYSRSHGILVGATIFGSQKSVQTPKSQESKPSPKPNEAKEKTQVAPEVSTIDRTELDFSSLEANRLVRQLTSMTTAPPIVAAGPATSDPNVSQTAGATPPKPSGR